MSSRRTTGLVQTFIALSAVPRYRVVKLEAGDNEVGLATAKSDPLIGVSAEPADTPAGARIDVIFSGLAEVQAGGIVAKGAWVTVDTSGRVITAASTDEKIGRALDAANAANDVISIEINKN